jgi:hypothetical protein
MFLISEFAALALWVVGVWIPARIIRDSSSLYVCHHLVSPSARSISAADDICRDTDIFNNDFIPLTDSSVTH